MLGLGLGLALGLSPGGVIQLRIVLSFPNSRNTFSVASYNVVKCLIV